MFKFSKSKHLNLLKIYEATGELWNEVTFAEKRRARAARIKKIKFFSYGILSLFLLAVIFAGYQLVILGHIYAQASAGKADLEASVAAAKDENFQEALDNSRAAQDSFVRAAGLAVRAENNFLISRIPFLSSQFADIEHLANTGRILARATGQGVGFAQEIKGLLKTDKKITFSKFSPEEKKKILGKLYESAPEFAGMKADLDLALLSLDQISYDGIFWPLKSELGNLREKVAYAQSLLAEAIPMSKILPVLSGYPEKAAYLVLLENSDELRPTGGFLGTYGILQVENGEIVRFDTHDIYHMDMPVQDRFSETPPEPIRKYLVPKWYLRDANWSPDWPTSSRKIEEFFRAEDALLPPNDKINGFSGQFDGLIALTPEFITDLLELTGPVTVEGQTYDKDNFSRLLEYRVEKNYVQLGIPSWQRKEVIGEISKELKIRLLDLPASRWGDIIAVLNDNFLKKNIQIFLKDADAENSIRDQGWGGEIKDVPGDYLMAVDANMGSLKTDAVMSKSIEYRLEEDGQGLIARARINYANNGKPDWRTDEYKTYTRLYVPSGSRLIKAEGLSDGSADVGEESGKTYFGGFIDILPGQIGSLTFEYRLPDYVKERVEQGNYELYLQKQAGNRASGVAVDLTFLNGIKSYSPTGFYAKREGRHIGWESDFNTDKRFEVNFK